MGPLQFCELVFTADAVSLYKLRVVDGVAEGLLGLHSVRLHEQRKLLKIFGVLLAGVAYLSSFPSMAEPQALLLMRELATA
jgi:hypothetical protein